MDVELPDGSVVEGVPDGMSQRDLVSLLSKNGHDTSWYKEPAPGIVDRIKSAFTSSGSPGEESPQGLDTNTDALALGVTNESRSLSVMDGFQSPEPTGEGMPVDAGMGPMRQDYYDTTRSGLLSAPVQDHAQAAQRGGQVGKVARDTLPGRLDNLERDLSGDTTPRTQQEFKDDTEASLRVQPLRSEDEKKANRQWLSENSKAAIEGIKRYTKMDQADAEAELEQMLKYGVKPAWVDDSMPKATLSQSISANFDTTGPALQKALLGLSEAAADQPLLQLPWKDYAKRTPRELESIVNDLDKRIRAGRNVGGKIESGSWNDVVSSMGPSLATNLPPLMAASLVAARNPAAGMAIASGGLGVMGLQKFGDTYLKGQMKGLSASDNLAYASLAAAAEVIPEKLSLNALFAVFKTMGKGAAVETIKAFAKQQLTEHTTEQITTISDHLIDKAYTEPDKSLESLWSEMKQTAMATAIQAPLLAGGGMLSHGVGQAAVAAKQKYDQSRDITAGMGFDPNAIDAAARGALDPARAQMEQVGQVAPPVVPTATPADVGAAPTPEAASTAIAEIGASLPGAAPISEVLEITQAEIDALLADPLIESAALPQTTDIAPPVAIESQPGAAAAGLLSGPVSPFDPFLAQGDDGRWKLSRPIDNQPPEFVSALIDEMDFRNTQPQGAPNAQVQAQQGAPTLQQVPQAAPEAGALPGELTPGTPEYNAYFEKKAAEEQEKRDADQREQRRSEGQAAVDKKNSWRKKLITWFDGAKDGDTITTDMADDDYLVIEKTIDRNGKKIQSKQLVQVGGRGDGLNRTVIEYRDGQVYQGPNTNQAIDPSAGFAQAPETDADSIGAQLGQAMEDGRAKVGAGAAPIVTRQGGNPTNLSAISGEISTPATPAATEERAYTKGQAEVLAPAQGEKSITQNKEGAIYVRGYPEEQMKAARDSLGIRSAVISPKGGVFPVGTPLAALKEALNPGAAYLPSRDEVSKMKDELREFIEDNKFNLRKAYNHVQKHGIQRFHDKAEAQGYADKLAKGEGGNWTVKRVNAKNGVMGYWHAEREGRVFSPVEQAILGAVEKKQVEDETALNEQEERAYDEVLNKAYAALDDDAVQAALDSMADQYGSTSAHEYRKAVREYFERVISEKLQGTTEGPAGVSGQAGGAQAGAGRDAETERQPEDAAGVAAPAEKLGEKIPPSSPEVVTSSPTVAAEAVPSSPKAESDAPPRVAETSDQMFDYLRKTAGGVVADGKILYPAIKVIGMGGTFQWYGDKVSKLGTVGDTGTIQPASESESADVMDALEKDQAQIILLSHWGGSGRGTGQKVVKVLHSPRGMEYKSRDEWLAKKPAVAQQAAPEASQPVATKEPWQMRRDDWVDGHIKSPGMHREHVRQAIARGDSVPTEVLTDYPDLTTKESESDAPFDSKAFDKARDERVKASKAAGNKHLDQVTPSVETMRGREIYYAHNPQQRGVIRTVDNRGNVYVYWADKYSADKELASEIVEDNKSWLKSSKAMPYMREVRDGKTYVFESSLGTSDLKDYVFVDGANPAQQPAEPHPNERPETTPKPPAENLDAMFDDILAEEVKATPARELTIDDVPPARLKKITVAVDAVVGDEIESMMVPAEEALADVEREISAFKLLLDCVKGK